MAEAGAAKRAVTIRDVAQAADVHISTVSRALDPKKSSLVSPATRAKVAAIAEELGYRPHLIASQLRRGQTRTLGVVVPDLGNPLYAPVTRGISQSLDRAGYMPLVADTQDDPTRFRRILRHLLNRRVDAFITTAARLGDRKPLLDMVAAGIPVVVAVRTLPGSGLPAVRHDDVLGGRLAAEHLLELGHRRLVQVEGPGDVDPFRQRSSGFTEAVERAGAELIELGDRGRSPTVEEGHRLMRMLLDIHGTRPTGVFAQNDLIALGVLQALREASLRCPEDYSVVGYNDAFFAAHAYPSLTTVRLPGYDVGRLAGAMAVECIEDPDRSPTSLTVPATLVVRGSTAAPSR